MARQVLGVEREVQRQRTAQPESGEEPEGHEPAGARCEGRGQSEHREDRDGEDETAPSPDAVGCRTPEPGTEQHADEAGGGEQPTRDGVEAELGTDRRQREPDEQHLRRVGRPGDPADRQEPPLEPTVPDLVDRLLDGGPPGAGHAP